MTTAWTHDALATDLAEHLAGNAARIVWTDMQLGPAGSPRPDIYTLDKSFAHFKPLAYEVKVSRADFLADTTAAKWQKYLTYATAVVFAVPAGLITRDEIPPGTGLILRHDTTWRTARRHRAKALETLPRDAWMKLVIDGVARTTDTRLTNARERATNWHAVERNIVARYGHDVAALVNEAIHNREHLERVTEDGRRRIEVARERNAAEASRISQELTNHLEPALRDLAAALDMTLPDRPLGALDMTRITGAVRRRRTDITADALTRAAREALLTAAAAATRQADALAVAAARLAPPAAVGETARAATPEKEAEHA